ncbi:MULTISPECIES: hypothetical protein [Glycomyces]|uniref:Uncharacterized protein n=2 Tax=Glycomyces TaxID=58113 RepID=A0A9X3PM92_9ACTN|nr:hypothetical protein [Glycomyces lechevalierae]MDA1386163.1 hypothetical protein [Glycomyces lechevalierae]MDR7338363.1 hypothetical protein [Glycomyces lechevalierae]
MALLSLVRDPVPARTKIALHLHEPYRTWLGFGRLRCTWCGERWGTHGCTARESAVRLFLYTATKAQRAAALESGDISPADLRLRRSTPTRHRRRTRPSPSPTAPNPLAALVLELQGAAR